MKKPTKKKPAKGVPMPLQLSCFDCFWTEDMDGMLTASFRIVPWTHNGKMDIQSMIAEHSRIMAWLANPATPKGVQR